MVTRTAAPPGASGVGVGAGPRDGASAPADRPLARASPPAGVTAPRRDRPVTRFIALDGSGQPVTPVLPCNSCGHDMHGEPA